MSTKQTGFQTIKITEVEAWPGLNPRMTFDKAALQELAVSIKEDGLLQPVSVAPAGLVKEGVKFWLFAGERRLRASQLAGLETIDVIVHDVDEATAHRLGGIENLDRNDLTAIEEAIWLQRELELTGGSQKALGEALGGRSPAWVSNRIRLLSLPAAIRKMIHHGIVAPAMARDTLLRFTKLGKADQSKLWKKIPAAIKEEAKDESPVQLAELRGAVADAVRGSVAVEASAGHHYEQRSNASFRVSEKAFQTFIGEHGARCFDAPRSHRQGSDTTYTFAVEEWEAVLEKALAEARATIATGGVPKKKLKAPKLSPTAEPVDSYELQHQYGHDNVIAFDQIVDPSKIDPANVAPVKKPGGKTELMYVGPNVRALKGARTRLKTPVRAEVAEKVQTERMDNGAALTTTEVLTGLLEAVVDTNFSSTLKGMIEAELGRAVKLDRYGAGKAQIPGLKIPAKSLKRIAAGIANLAIAKVDYWHLDGAIDKAVETRVTKDTAKARKAWLDEHAPKGGK